MERQFQTTAIPGNERNFGIKKRKFRLAATISALPAGSDLASRTGHEAGCQINAVIFF